MSQELTAERDRFLVLFDRLAEWTNRWIELTPSDKLDWIPLEQDSVKYGDRLARVTTKNLYIHTIVAETCWADALARCEEGKDIGLPLDPKLSEELDQGDFVERAAELHKRNMEVFGGYSEEQLATNILFIDREWTTVGFLWGIYSHRAFHLGNVDIYLRQSGVEAPDFFAFPAAAMA